MVACVEGTSAVQMVRNSVGATNPLNAAPGTIRADLALDIGRNLIHASDAPETAERELALWFTPDELTTYDALDAGSSSSRLDLTSKSTDPSGC